MFSVYNYALTLSESRSYIKDGYRVFALVDFSGFKFSGENFAKGAIADQWAPPEVISLLLF
jgi:hypothetical protein